MQQRDAPALEDPQITAYVSGGSVNISGTTVAGKVMSSWDGDDGSRGA
jgi:hypothetical protein